MKLRPLAGAVIATVLLLSIPLWFVLEGTRPRTEPVPTGGREARGATRTTGDTGDTGTLLEPTIANLDERQEEDRTALPAIPSAEEEHGPASRGEPSPELATLRVRVVEAGTGAPVPDVLIDLCPLGVRRTPRRRVQASEARLGEVPRTDAEGEATCVVPPDSYRLRVQGRSELHEDLPDVESKEIEVRDLREDEVRDVSVVLLTGDDLVFHGRVLDDGTDAPVGDARVSFLRPGTVWTNGTIQDRSERLVELVSDRTGRFEALVPSWKPVLARVEAAGYAPTFVPVTRNHEHPEDARIVRLQPGCTLRATVLTNGAPTEGITVSLSTRIDALVQRTARDEEWYRHVPPTWNATTGPEGRCTLADLPGRIPLEVQLLRDARKSTKEVGPLVLEPGEVREQTWSLGTGASILGFAHDEYGRPQPGMEIWLDRAEPERPARRFYWFERDRVERAWADGEGRFRFDDVPAGDWWIGPGEISQHTVTKEPAPTAERLTIEEGETERHVALTIDRGLYVRGHVLDPEGSPVAGTAVYTSGWDHASTQTTEDGSFALGPLEPGEHELQADSMESFRSSAPLTVAAGAEDVVLRLRPGASLRGRVVARDDEVGGANVWLSAEWIDDLEGGYVDEETTRSDGSFQFDHLAPGTYAVFARSAAGDVGLVRGVAVDIEREPPEVLLRMEPGGRLHVRCEGDPAPEQYAVVLHEGHYVAESPLRPAPSGSEVSLITPPGSCTVRLFRPGEEPGSWEFIEQSLLVLAGQDQAITFRPESTPFLPWEDPIR